MFPDRTREIKVHRETAYSFLKQGEFDRARQSFFSYVESVRQQSINTGGDLEKELAHAQKEYSEFARQDPFYIRTCETILPKIAEQPGVLQTDLYKLFPDIEKEGLRYVLYFAADHGRIKREKKGRSYALFPVDK